MIFYYDSYSILVLNKRGLLRRLYTPFRAICSESVEDLQVDTKVYVDEVFPDEDCRLLYKIGGNLYPYFNFRILMDF